MKASSLVFLLALSINAWGIVTAETEAAARKLGASSVGEVEFDSGKTEISDLAQKDLENLKSDAAQAGDITEVRVIAWADKEYPPAEHKKYTSDDVKLAEARATQVRDFLKKHFQWKNIITYNMAKRPNIFQEMLNTPAAAIKNTLEKSGAAPHSEEDTGLFAEKSKSSTALILVFKKTKP